MRLVLACILMLLAVATAKAYAHIHLSEKNRVMPVSMLFEVSTPQQLLELQASIPDETMAQIKTSQLTDKNILPRLLILTNETDSARQWTLTRPADATDNLQPSLIRLDDSKFTLHPSQTLNWPTKILLQSVTIPPYQRVEILLAPQVLPTQLWSNTWLTHSLAVYAQYACLILGGIFATFLLQVILALLNNRVNLLLLTFQFTVTASLVYELGLVEILLPPLSGNLGNLIGLILPILSVFLFIEMRRKQEQEMNYLLHYINVTLYGTVVAALVLTAIHTQVSLPAFESILPSYLIISLSSLMLLCGYTLFRLPNVHHLCDFGIIVFMVLFCATLADMVTILDKMLLYLPVLGINLLCFISAQIGATKNSSNSQPLANQLTDIQETTLQRRFEELEMSHRLLQEKNAIDFLTGLKNRQFFDERYHQELSRSARENTPFSLILIDLDHFKCVNDQYGHQIGDEVLKLVAKRFYYALNRPADAICRYGGEEFVILLPNTHIQGAAHVAHQLRKAISSKPILTSRGNIGVTISQGVACVSHQAGFEEIKLLSLADEALYRAKNLGRDRFELATLKPCIVKEQANTLNNSSSAFYS